MSSNDTDFWYGLLFGLGSFVLGTVILVVILIQVGAFSRARIARREQSEERTLTDRYEELAHQAGQHQQSASAELVTIRERLDAIETMLREVE